MPAPRSKVVPRARLIERLDAGLDGKLTLISAAAGFGKTTLVSEWVAALQTSPLPGGEGPGVRVAWLSLDEGDSDPTRFLAYLIAALQTVAPPVGQGALAALQAPQPPPPEAILTAVLNDLAALPDRFLLVLDDYHAVDAPLVDQALAFLLQNLPPPLHLVIASREDPPLPLARLRARGQLTELRAADLRFTPDEAAEFLNQVMGLSLSPAEMAALEARTEGWIAGLHLAALSMQGRTDTAAFVETFSGSHRFVLDYLVEEVLQRQPAGVQDFLLRTAILDRLCGPLCDAVLQDGSASGQDTLAYLERANLFIVSLDNERRWYRYHHLFGELLRQRLHQQQPGAIADLHRLASLWYEDNDLELEAFHHAAAAGDLDRAERLLEGRGMPLLFRGAARPVLRWLASLPAAELNSRPSLWVTYASALLFISQVAGVEEKLQAAEAALRDVEPDARIRDLLGHIASIRATVAVTQHDAEAIIAQSQRSLAYLHPANLPVRTAATWSLAYAHQLQGDRAAAGRAYAAALAASEAMGHFIITLMSTLGVGNLQEADNQLAAAAGTFRRALQLAGDPPLPVVCGAHLGLARISYQWNELDAAQEHGQQGLHLARQIEYTDRFVACELFLARLKLAQGDTAGATALLAAAEQAARQQNFVLQMPEIAALHVLVSLRQGDLAAAAQAAQAHDAPLSQARVVLAQGDTGAALAALAAYRQQAEARGWADERLKAMILQALACQAHGERDRAVSLLGEALALALSGGFVRVFVDEGPAMAQLLSRAAARGVMPEYTARLLAAMAEEDAQPAAGAVRPASLAAQPLIEPLSERELEVLRLIAQGLSNQEIGERLFLALDSVKGHNRHIFDKLEVQRRTEAVARARELGLL
jgi:LuxR family maltose regulon positive regulatory protein